MRREQGVERIISRRAAEPQSSQSCCLKALSPRSLRLCRTFGSKSARISLLSSLLIVLCSLFFATCSTPTIDNTPALPPGMGSVTLTLSDSVSRTIFPVTPQLSELPYFFVDFTPTATPNGAVAASFPLSLVSDNTLEAVTLSAGNYNLILCALVSYVDFVIPENIIAIGSAPNITIVPGVNNTFTVNLKMLLDQGFGNFRWNISLADITDLTSAVMTVSKSGDDAFPPVNLVTRPDSFENLASGVYNVFFELTATNKKVEWHEILHIYASLDSRCNMAFKNDHFSDTHHVISFNENFSGGDVHPQTVSRGSALGAANVPVPASRTGFSFAGWYTDNGTFLVPFDPTVSIYQDITVYAKWLDNNLDIDIDYQKILDVDTGLPDTPVILYRDAVDGGSKTFTVHNTFSNAEWYLNNETNSRGTGLEFILDERDIDINGIHFLTVIAWVGSVPYSRTIEIEVSELLFNTIEKMIAYLDIQTGGANANSPILLPLAVNLSTGDNWLDILAAINAAGKFVDLDLSECNMMGTEYNPVSTISIGKNRIVSLILPNTATSIADDLAIENGTFNHFSNLELVSGTNIITIGDGAFIQRASLISVNFPAATSIGDIAFIECTSLISANFPAVTFIGEGAFSGSNNLTSVNFPAAAIISHCAFMDCSNLTTVNVPAVTFIGQAVFDSIGNNNITIILGSNAPALEINVMGSTSRTVNVRVPSGATGYGIIPGTYNNTDNTTQNWGNALRGMGWNGTNYLTGTVRTDITVNIVLDD